MPAPNRRELSSRQDYTVPHRNFTQSIRYSTSDLTSRPLATKAVFVRHSRLKPLPQNYLALQEMHSRLKPLPQNYLALQEMHSRLKPLV